MRNPGIVLLALAARVAAPAISSAAEEPAPAAKIRFETVTHDFGAVRSDTKVQYRWAFSNVGNAPLRILGLKPSCACTATAVDDRPVPPGGQGFIDVTFDPVGQSGVVKKSLVVTSNDPSQKVVILRMTASVTPAVLVAPTTGHPPISGQSMLFGSCASCHAAPAAGKNGEALYAAICAMCHGKEGSGGRAPSIREASYLRARDDRALAEAIAYGTTNPKMPGFGDSMGGPLTPAQVESLVKLLRAWGAASAAPPTAVPPGSP